jgi:O-antigen ligase
MAGQTTTAVAIPWSGRAGFARVADGLAVATVASLPWSTSATAILVVLWIAAALLAFGVAPVRKEILTAAGGFPVLLWGLAALGMLWAQASWSDRYDALGSFHKLLMIPVVLAHLRRSDIGCVVLKGFLISNVALLAASAAHALLWTTVSWPFGGQNAGIPVKDYLAQSAEFQLCIFALAQVALDAWRRQRRRVALGATVLALLFLANIAFVVTGRTALVAMPVLLVLFAVRQFHWRGVLAVLTAGALLAAALWASSPYLRLRVGGIIVALHEYHSGAAATSIGQRLEFWRDSVGLIAASPLIGHGTGSLAERFRHAAAGERGPSSIASQNPHQQVLAVAIQLGLIGTALLVAMWIAHLALVRSPGLVAWSGLMVVVQNIVSSQFNTHLFDFTHGWLYVFGVGVAGGTVLRRSPGTRMDGVAEQSAQGAARTP